MLGELRIRLAEQPLRERTAALLIKALYLSGRQADAVAVYGGTRQALAEELGVEPSPELQQVHLAVLRRDPGLTPALTQDGRGRLPARLTTFIGRQREVTEVVRRLADVRLVTLVGPGGAGKTRLSTEVAAAISLPGWFVELAGVGEPADLAGAVLTALGLREVRMLETTSGAARPQEPVERLVEALGGQQALIILDNCEHVITAAAALADTLLSHCSGIRILATSREPLAITGEVAFPVGPLELPKPTATLDGLRDSEAVRLFVDRASSAHPGFVLDDGNAAAVAEICHRLDGLPLALELAAARLRSMTVGQIAERLDDRFRLLTAGSRTSMPRHRTLRAVVEWSWDLLEKPERILVRRLAVFPAGATVESATAVCADDELAAADVLYVLSSLVEKSLVEASAGVDGQPRYRMLETVRAYATERLAEAGEETAVRAAFAQYFRDLIEEADPHLRGPDQVRWLARLSAEHDNAIAAVRYAADAGNAATAVRLAMATGWFWALSGRQREVQALAKRVLEVPGPAPEHARATLRLFSLMAGPGMPDRDAIVGLRAELEKTDAMRHFPVLAMVEPLLAVFTGDMAAAEAAAGRAQRHADPWARAAARLGRAMLAENEGRADDGERHAVEALAAFRDLGDRWGQAMALSQLSERRTLRADHAGAIAAYEESLELVSQLGAIDDLPELIARLADQRARAGDLDGADRELRKGFAAASERASVDMEAFLLCARADLSRRRGDLDAAAENMDRAASVLANVARPEGHWRAFYEMTQSAISVARGEPAAARTALRRAFDTMLEVRDLPVMARIAERLAYVATAEGDVRCAARLIGLAAALRGTPDLGNAELKELIGNLTAAMGEAGYDTAYRQGTAVDRDGALAELRGLLDAP